MTEEKNIEQEIIDKFYDCSSKYKIYEWLSFIGKIDSSELKSTLIIVEIDFNLDLENWELEQLNFEFLITKNSNINFQNCSFNSLNIISSNNIILNDVVIRKCNFKGDVKINIKSNSAISLDGNKFHGKKCIIDYFTENSSNPKNIYLQNTEFGYPHANNKNDFELQIFSDNDEARISPSSNSDEKTKFSANNFILKTNLQEFQFKQFEFNINKLIIEGDEKKPCNLDFKFGNFPEYIKEQENSKQPSIVKEIELKNLNEIKKFSWENGESNPKKLSFENVKKIEVNNLKNLDLSGSIASITSENKEIENNLAKFENCNFKNISGEIIGNIIKETTFENCENIKKIVAGEVHKITIKSSTISQEINLKNCDLLKIEDSNIEKITLENCQFNDAIILNNVTFSQSPHISNIKFSSHNVELRNLKFNENLSPQASGSYRALMKLCQDAGYENGVIFFHAKELETRHNYLKNNIKKSVKKFKIFSIFDEFIEIILLSFYNIFSKYGASLFRPLLWIFLIFVISISCCVLINNGEFYLFFSSIDLLKLTIRNSLGPLIFALPKGFVDDEFFSSLPSFIKVLCFFQAVICSSIWFVWFFMVRRRFKV